jgi:glycosyltransferase involved in cell wall biosynthesis
MQILHIAYSDTLDGACQAAYRIHSGLNSSGITSRMLVVRKHRDDETVIGPVTRLQKIRSKIVPNLGSMVSQLLRRKQIDVFSYNWFGYLSYSDIEKVNADIINLHWIGAETIKFEELRRLNLPVVWRLPDMWPFSGSEHYTFDNKRQSEGYLKNNRPENQKGIDIDRWVWKRKKTAYNCIKNLTIVAPSKWLAKCASESVLFSKRRIEVIHTGIELDKFAPVNKSEARIELKLPPDDIIVLAGASSVNHARKGFGILKEALQKLSGTQSYCHKITIVLFGLKIDPELLANLKFNVIQMGHIKNYSEMAAIYSAADIFVAPSILENLANTVIESMACKTPVVAFNIGGMPDIILHKQNGYLASQVSVDSLAEGIQWTLENQSLWPSLRECAHKTVVNEFSNKIQINKYIELYKQILSNER